MNAMEGSPLPPRYRAGRSRETGIHRVKAETCEKARAGPKDFMTKRNRYSPEAKREAVGLVWVKWCRSVAAMFGWSWAQAALRQHPIAGRFPTH